MKLLGIVLALAGLLALPAMADQLGGLTGTVIDLNTGQPIANATIYYYRSPWLENGPNHVMRLQTNSRGFFSDITLDPGRYVVMARVPGKVQGCAVDDIMGGEVARLRIEIGRNQVMCSGPRVHPALVDPGATADIYRI
jgi:Carboxypeptidase regulatory-like domain